MLASGIAGAQDDGTGLDHDRRTHARTSPGSLRGGLVSQPEGDIDEREREAARLRNGSRVGFRRVLSGRVRVRSIMFTLFQRKEESAAEPAPAQQTSMLLETQLSHVPHGCQ